jgi:RNA polymerase primary sigma factor
MQVKNPKQRSRAESQSFSSDESLNEYMKQLNKFPVLTREEEVYLAKSILKSKKTILKFCSKDMNILSIFLNYETFSTSKVKKLFINILDDDCSDEEVEKLHAKFINLLKLKLSGEKAVGLSKMIKSLNFSYTDLLKFVKVMEKDDLDKTYKEFFDAIYELESSRKRLTECNLRLVFSRAKRFLQNGLSIEDFIQEGNLGLLRAIEKFDYTKGYKFSTYATHWIEQAFGRALSNKSRLIRIPVHVVETLNKLNKIKKSFDGTKWENLSIKELARLSGETEAKVKKVLEFDLIKETYLEDCYVENNSELKLLDIIAQEDTDSALETLNKKELYLKLRKALASLKPRDEKIIRLRFGIGEKTSNTLENIGEVFDLSKERIRQIEKSSIKKVKRALKKL